MLVWLVFFSFRITFSILSLLFQVIVFFFSLPDGITHVAVLSALRSLQDKIRKLESEKLSYQEALENHRRSSLVTQENLEREIDELRRNSTATEVRLRRDRDELSESRDGDYVFDTSTPSPPATILWLVPCSLPEPSFVALFLCVMLCLLFASSDSVYG